jgi:hypothetical protein
LLRTSAFAVPFFTFVLACSSESSPALDNGVNDVKGACLIRASWTAPLADRCEQCRAVASLEDCGCEALRDFGAKCVVQGRAKRAEPTCTPAIDDCVLACGTDCNCADACYANAPACKSAAAAEQGCIADVCSVYCTAEAGAPGAADGG